VYKTSVKLPASLNTVEIALLGQSLDEISQANTALREENNHQSPWVLEWLVEARPDLSDLKARILINAQMHAIALPETLSFEVEDVPEINWLEHSYKQFPPFSVGPFFIYGSHDSKKNEEHVPDGQIGLQIDAATAFGSGEHGTTKGCLQAMLDLKGQGACPWNILDMGTGSGILAIAAWKLWKTPILAVDNDPESIALTQRHLKSNGIADSKSTVQTQLNEGFAGTCVQDKGPFDLIIANILPGPLKSMATDLVTCADENGYIILSGILNEQVRDVLDVYEPLGLSLKKHIEICEWSTLLLHNPAT